MDLVDHSHNSIPSVVSNLVLVVRVGFTIVVQKPVQGLKATVLGDVEGGSVLVMPETVYLIYLQDPEGNNFPGIPVTLVAMVRIISFEVVVDGFVVVRMV